MNYVVGVSKSRAKRKQRQRARAAGTTAPGRQPAGGAPPVTPRGGGAKASGAAGGAKGRGDAGGKASGAAGGGKASAGARGAKARGGKARTTAGGATGGPRPVRDGDMRRPDPVWAPFPLTEIGMGVGIAIFGVGYATTNTWLLGVGAVMLAVVVAELCVREHFAGYRSHALLLAALTVVAAHSLVFAIDDAYRGPVALVVDLAIGAALAWWLRGRFKTARAGHATA